jgi:SAM-dependent methyltransferase
MLAEARRRAPGARLLRGDLRALPFAEGVEGAFDVVTCLFAAVGYLPTEGAVLAAVRGAAALLRPGGLLALEPPVAAEAVRPPERSVMEFEHEGVPVRRAVEARVEEGALRILFDFRVGGEGWREEHRIRLLPPGLLPGAMEAAGLGVRREAGGLFPLGILLGRR